MRVSYAQRGEDLHIAHALYGVHRGTYVDVGAYHPIHMSVTHNFYMEGWRGVLVEPDYVMAKQLRQRRPNDQVFQVAASDYDGTANLAVYPNKPGWATVDAATQERHEQEDNLQTRWATVECMTLNTILQTVDHPGIDFINIDVEGHELAVLTGFNLDLWHPRLICIESVVPGVGPPWKPNYKEWEPKLLDAGYACGLDDGVNRYYAAQPHILRRLKERRVA